MRRPKQGTRVAFRSPVKHEDPSRVKSVCKSCGRTFYTEADFEVPVCSLDCLRNMRAGLVVWES